MNNVKSDYKNKLNSRKINIKPNIKLSILKDESLLCLIKKNRFKDKISATELDLSKKEAILKQFNSKHNSINQKILDQIQTISRKVNENNVLHKKNKMLDDILFTKSDKDINSVNNINKFKRENSFHFQSASKRRIIKLNSNKYNIKKNNSTRDKKNNNYLMNSEKKKFILPPISHFKFKIHRIKLNINNDIDKNEEEKMMKLYKELEFQNKNKFVI